MAPNSQKLIGNILKNLSSVRSDLQTLSDTIWTSIDHNDPEELEKFIGFKKIFSNLHDEFKKNSEYLVSLITDFTGYDETIPPPSHPSSTPRRRQTPPPVLNSEGPHHVNENFTGLKPLAFIIENYSPKLRVNSWSELTSEVCKVLANLDFEKLYRLALNGVVPLGTSNFNMGSPQKIANQGGRYIWLNTQHNIINLMNYTKKLLDLCDVDPYSLKI